MGQAPKKKKRRLPKNATKLPAHDLMERIFGKRIMKEVDRIVAERSDDAEKPLKDKGNVDALEYISCGFLCQVYNYD